MMAQVALWFLSCTCTSKLALSFHLISLSLEDGCVKLQKAQSRKRKEKEKEKKNELGVNHGSQSIKRFLLYSHQ